MNTPWSHTPDSPSGSRTPYAGPPEPQSASTREVARTPYVPAAFRTRPHTMPAIATPTPSVEQATEHELPWISAFAPEALQEASPEAQAEPTAQFNAESSTHDDAVAQSDGRIASGVTDPIRQEHAAPEHSGRAEDWPFSEAGAEMSELSGELPARDPFADPFLAGAAPPALPMWSDDDMMDIMPVRALRQDPQSDEDGQGASGEVSGENREAAARALEGLATRVRDGELALPGYASTMGDAAALASALAALLGARH